MLDLNSRILNPKLTRFFNEKYMVQYFYLGSKLFFGEIS